ncbi:MAG: hypothetical protein IT210_23400 [Armatimonadetes bacterium]|nr:hypothetical protein [Armatimonadota bacterium]
MVIANNLPYGEYTRSAPAASARSRADENQLPAGQNAFLVSCFDPFWAQGLFATADDTLNVLQNVANQSGYAVTKYVGTVDNLKRVRNADIVYIDGHGTLAQLPAGPGVLSTKIYCLPTATVITPGDDLRLAEDIADGSVGPALVGARHATEYLLAQHYYITPKFVRKYWNLHPNSLVYLNTCMSQSDPEATSFRRACWEQNASAYVGWSRCITAFDAAESARYLFNGIAGQNDLGDLKKNPPQRPFSSVRYWRT